jgi:hypothetical protein
MGRMNRKIALRSPSQIIPPESRSSERESSPSIILSPFYPQTALPSAALSANYTRDIQFCPSSRQQFPSKRSTQVQPTEATHQLPPLPVSKTRRQRVAGMLSRKLFTDFWCLIIASVYTSNPARHHHMHPPSTTHRVVTHSHSFTCQESTHVGVG